MKLHNLGYPKIGANREWKSSLESYWKNKINLEQLNALTKEIRTVNWNTQIKSGQDFISVGDFNHYDHVLNMSLLLGVADARFKQHYPQEVTLDMVFLMARGYCNDGWSTQACEMTKWFDTNYHYIVPELQADQKFKLDKNAELFSHIREASPLGKAVKPVIIGPLSFLWLAKARNENFNKLDLLPDLIEAYNELFKELNSFDLEWVQVDEPILSLDLEDKWKQAFQTCYEQLHSGKLKLLIATYFGDAYDNLDVALSLNQAGYHFDCINNHKLLAEVSDRTPLDKVLSLGLIDGRNIWKADLNAILERLKPIYQVRTENLWLAPSCSLLHCPVDLNYEDEINPEIKSWLAFSNQKLDELAILKNVLTGASKHSTELGEIEKILKDRQESNLLNNRDVQVAVEALEHSEFNRNSNYANRKELQRNKFNLPLFPTTTIGSFPQTDLIRQARRNFKKNKIDLATYEDIIKTEIKNTILKQEEIDLDILVHGEAERNDMVEYFGEKLAGFAFSKNGWVVSYGSRCVKPPIIYGDVSRPAPMTIKWLKYASEQTKKNVKGMLTGPITMYKWSFVRDDIPLKNIVFQIALALKEEVLDLEKAGINIIQIDEPALREAMPLKKAAANKYLVWATKAFRICTFELKDETQVHTHMCYCEFNEIIDSIAQMDSDVISIEASRSNYELLDGLAKYHYPNDIGPGIYDIHSPNVPEVDSMRTMFNRALKLVPKERLWINPDCGLKTRAWPETIQALTNMVQVAKQLRSEYTDVSN